jgi:hypothetical protein
MMWNEIDVVPDWNLGGVYSLSVMIMQWYGIMLLLLSLFLRWGL